MGHDEVMPELPLPITSKEEKQTTTIDKKEAIWHIIFSVHLWVQSLLPQLHKQEIEK